MTKKFLYHGTFIKAVQINNLVLFNTLFPFDENNKFFRNKKVCKIKCLTSMSLNYLEYENNLRKFLENNICLSNQNIEQIINTLLEERLITHSDKIKLIIYFQLNLNYKISNNSMNKLISTLKNGTLKEHYYNLE
ncbi:MAG: hypothetical protein ABIM30_01295 [candidate division WOR-3 bacterium]